jgi:hypothetical protein
VKVGINGSDITIRIKKKKDRMMAVPAVKECRIVPFVVGVFTV